MNPMQFIMQLMSQGVDPRQMVINMLSNNPNLDKVGQNVLNKAKENDLDGATTITRNAANERGMKF